MRRKIINKGIYNENQTASGGKIYNIIGDQNVIQDSTGLSLDEFQSLLNEVRIQLRELKVPKSEMADIQAIVTQVMKQAQKKTPKKSLIVGPLITAFELVKQAGGAATAAVTIAQLLQKAIAYAEKMF